MKSTTVTPNLVQLTRWPLLFPINMYLVREEDELTLIDTGMSGAEQAIIAEATKMGLPITRILLTHAHTDHVGSLAALAKKLPDAEIMMSARTAQFLKGDLTQPDDEAEKGQLRGGFKVIDVPIAQTLQPGDRVGSLEVVAAPGHSPDQIAFFDVRDQTLIAGDAFITRGGVAVTGVFRLLFPFPALATWHKPTALESARRLRALDPARLAVGHGPIIDAPSDAIDDAIAEAEAKFETQAQHAS
jgi:glyoxylase-like metal-dependent hydrolase (beta-lactamase superfamily II)